MKQVKTLEELFPCFSGYETQKQILLSKQKEVIPLYQIKKSGRGSG